MNEYQLIVSKMIEAYRRGYLVVVKNAERQILHGAEITENDAEAIVHGRRSLDPISKLTATFPTAVLQTALSGEEWFGSALPEFCAAAQQLAIQGQFPRAKLLG